MIYRSIRYKSSESLLDWIKEFFGFESSNRESIGLFSKTHLIFATIVTLLIITIAILLGRHFKNKSEEEKIKPIKYLAVLMWLFEGTKIVINLIQGDSIWGMLPLFLCSIQLVTIPLVALLKKGRLRDACCDFIFIWGFFTALMALFFAGNFYNNASFVSFWLIGSVVTHSISGIASLYIGISGLAKMEKKNIYITVLILLSFEILAFTANQFTDYNYMFLESGDGTPFDLIQNMYGGERENILYSLTVAFMMQLFSLGYYAVDNTVVSIKHKQKEKTKTYKKDGSQLS